MRIDFRKADHAFDSYLKEMMAKGTPFRDTKALFNQCFTIHEPEDNIITHKIRGWNQKYADREWEWYVSGDKSAKNIAPYAPLWHNMMDEWGEVWSNYGWWWKQGDQLEEMIKKLKKDTETRQAMLVHYNPNYIDRMKNDVPCNVVLNFYITEGFLNLTIFARSIDLWFGFCNDQYQFSKLMIEVGKAISKPVGEMTYMITNFHLYNKQVDYVRTQSGAHIVTGAH